MAVCFVLYIGLGWVATRGPQARVLDMNRHRRRDFLHSRSFDKLILCSDLLPWVALKWC